MYDAISASLNTMEKLHVHPTICKILQYYALLRVVSIQGAVPTINGIQLIGARS